MGMGIRGGGAARQIQALFDAGAVGAPGRWRTARPVPRPRRLGRARRSPPWLTATVGWSSASAGTCSATPTRPRTPRRRRSSSSPARPPRSGSPRPCRAGSTGPPEGSPRGPCASRSAAGSTSAGAPRFRPQTRIDESAQGLARAARGAGQAPRSLPRADRPLRPGRPDARAGRREARMPASDARDAALSRAGTSESRLVRRGVAPSAAWSGTAWAGNPLGALRPDWASSTASAAVQLKTGAGRRSGKSRPSRPLGSRTPQGDRRHVPREADRRGEPAARPVPGPRSVSSTAGPGTGAVAAEPKAEPEPPERSSTRIGRRFTGGP